MSSFIRQLNMYGFHKISLLNSSITNDKVEVEFVHPYFQRDEPGLLGNIKRKVTTSRHNSEKNVPEVANQDQLSKLMADVKYLHNRQAQVDVVINNLKRENSVLWRELAVLRQKHQKQIQIVNKLIQFLLTVVQPSTRRSGLGVKRRYPLMLNENPEKKTEEQF
uniref:HSF-type DNA-binding domain-containing protein n=1 Tax=Photinus pyralis TaxID=7054 RepID=A0A1Y1KQ65_PHOPY